MNFSNPSLGWMLLLYNFRNLLPLLNSATPPAANMASLRLFQLLYRQLAPLYLQRVFSAQFETSLPESTCGCSGHGSRRIFIRRRQYPFAPCRLELAAVRHGWPQSCRSPPQTPRSPPRAFLRRLGRLWPISERAAIQPRSAVASLVGTGSLSARRRQWWRTPQTSAAARLSRGTYAPEERPR